MADDKELGIRVDITAEVYENVDHSCTQLLSGGRSDKLYKDFEKGGGNDGDKCRKRKKPRRGKPKKPQWIRRTGLSDKDGDGSPTLEKRRRSNIFIHGQPAPNNTTQFIMEDHTDLQDLDAQLTAQGNASNGPGCSLHKTSRARDSSFSVDSDEEFYSSPEDEEEFLTKEFSNTYEDVHVERLGTMSKSELIQEYLQLEERVDLLEKKLQGNQSAKSADQKNCTGTDSDGEANAGETPMDPAMAEKIRIFQAEISKLMVENEQLAKENNRLRTSGNIVRPSSSLSSSVDSESDSSTSSGSSSSSSSAHSHVSQSSRGSRGTRSSKSSQNHSSHSHSRSSSGSRSGCTPTSHSVNGSSCFRKSGLEDGKPLSQSSDDAGGPTSDIESGGERRTIINGESTCAGESPSPENTLGSSLAAH